jgi:RimJ/RimL family protein N-acetyltransferase
MVLQPPYSHPRRLDTFATARLMAHRPTASDFDVLRKIHSDKETMRTLSADGRVLDEPTTRDILTQHLAHWNTHGFGLWLFVRRSDGAEIGYCGLRNYNLDGIDEIELFFGIASAFFRRGYGTEMTQRVLEIGVGDLGFQSIVGFTLDRNRASRALMEKLGMQFGGVVNHADLPHRLYRFP